MSIYAGCECEGGAEGGSVRRVAACISLPTHKVVARGILEGLFRSRSHSSVCVREGERSERRRGDVKWSCTAYSPGDSVLESTSAAFILSRIGGWRSLRARRGVGCEMVPVDDDVGVPLTLGENERQMEEKSTTREWSVAMTVSKSKLAKLLVWKGKLCRREVGMKGEVLAATRTRRCSCWSRSPRSSRPRRRTRDHDEAAHGGKAAWATAKIDARPKCLSLTSLSPTSALEKATAHDYHDAIRYASKQGNDIAS